MSDVVAWTIVLALLCAALAAVAFRNRFSN
jgi:hypothetical protein